MKIKLTFALMAFMTSTAFAAFQAPLPEFKNEKQLAEWRAEKASESTSQGHAAEEAAFYTGKPYLASTGSYAFKYRSYNPQVARWTSEDPSGFPDGSNNQLYVNNSSINCFDPSGLSTWTVGVLDWNQHKFEVPSQYLSWGTLGLATGSAAAGGGVLGAKVGGAAGTLVFGWGAIPGTLIGGAIGAGGAGAAVAAATINTSLVAFMNDTENYYKRDHSDQVYGAINESFYKTMTYELGQYPTLTGSTKSVTHVTNYNYEYTDLGVKFGATVWSSEVFHYE